MTRDIPIIFSAPMVLALLAGRKTQTRRLAWRAQGKPSSWQKVRAGDRLWVRENFATTGGGPLRYPATDDVHELRKVTPSIHMPRWASRLTLEVTATKVERLHDIHGLDAIAEGLVDLNREGERWHWDPKAPYGAGHFSPQRAFAALWRSMHGEDSWKANPDLVALTFKVHQRNIDAMDAR